MNTLKLGCFPLGRNMNPFPIDAIGGPFFFRHLRLRRQRGYRIIDRLLSCASSP